MKPMLNIVSLLFLFSCQSANSATILNGAAYSNLQILTSPRQLDFSKTAIAFANYNPSLTPFDFYKNNKEQVLGELANHDVLLRAYSVATDGKISLLPSLFVDARKKVVVQRDYINYKTIVEEGKTKKIGILFRIEAQLETKNTNVDLSGLFAIGLAVKQGSASGQLRVEVHGLSGEPISSLIPSPADISESSIQNAMEAVAGLKAKIYDPKVFIIPQEIID